MIRVVIADDHHLVREGTRALIERADDICVIGEAQDGQSAVEITRELAPDVLILDIAMPRLNGIQTLEYLKHERTETNVVILSMYMNEILMRRALQNGAKGYLLKDSVSEELILAIRAASRGATYLSPKISGSVLRDYWQTPAPAAIQGLENPLTPREYEVLQLISEGYTNNKIGQALNISVKTVERHRSKIMSKLGANNLVGLIRAALKYGLIVLDE